MSQRRWWQDPDYRRDVLIVLALFGLGLLINIGAGLILCLVFEQLGWLEPLASATRPSNWSRAIDSF